MIELKSGDFVKILGKKYWVCDCNVKPLGVSRCSVCKKRRPTPCAVDLGDSSPLQSESTPEVNFVAQADTTPAQNH